MTLATAAVITPGAIGESRHASLKLIPKIALPVNGHVLVDGVEHIVERRLGDKWHLLSFEKDILFLSDEEVAGKMAEGALIVRHGDGRAPSKDRRSLGFGGCHPIERQEAGFLSVG
jgi:hypothetical protein